MTLYEFLEVSKRDYDTFEIEMEAEVTVCYIEQEHDNYDRFCNGIIKKVDVIKQTGDYSLLVAWSDLIKRNIDKFKEFTKQHWENQYEDDTEEFIYQWIKEIDSYMSGSAPYYLYKTLMNFVETLE